MPPLEREALLPRIDGIGKNLIKLKSLGLLPLDAFSTGDSFDLAQHHLRLALEGVFHIGTHLLSRLPGERATEYREIGTKLADAGIVTQEFAERALVPMAKMRNLLVHQYADIDPRRLQEVIKLHLRDIELFLVYITNVIQNPTQFNLTIQ